MLSGLAGLRRALPRTCLLGRDEFGLRFIEALLLRRFVPQPCRREETGAITLRQLIGLTNKFLDPDRVDIADRATRPCRETPTIDSAKIGILRRQIGRAHV